MHSPFTMTVSMPLSDQLIRLIVPQDVVTLLFLIVMIGLLLFLLLRVLLPLLQISRRIRQSTEMIRALAGKSRRNVGLIHDLDHEAGFLNHPLLKNNWKLFKSDLQSVENHPELCEIEEYFTEDSIIHTLGKSQVAELAPGIFTTLGILGTFVGLYMGLQLFNVPADVTGDVASQQLTASTNGLIEGIKTAFQTSIYGIAFSLFFNTLYRRLVNQTRRALDDFLAAFRKFVTPHSANRPLALMVDFQEKQAEQFDRFAATFSQNLADNLNQTFQPTLDQLQLLMDQFVHVASARQSEALQGVVDAFIANLNQSLDNQFDQLGKNLHEINAWQSSVQLQSRELIEHIHGTSRHMSDVDSRTLSLISHYDQYIDQLRQSLALAAENIDHLVAAKAQSSGEHPAARSEFAQLLQQYYPNYLNKLVDTEPPVRAETEDTPHA